MEMTKGKHDHTCTLRLTENEFQAIMEKMKLAGMSEKSAYLRRMAIDGYVLRIDFPEMKELISLMRYSSNNLNQIAKKANEAGSVAASDIKEIQEGQERLWDGINKILRKLGEIP